jgi:hypothetical protein
MAKKLYLIIGAAIIIVAIIAAAFVSTQNSTNPPVKVVSSLVPGDNFIYSIKGYTDIIEGNGTIPANFSELNKTDSYQLTITNVNV